MKSYAVLNADQIVENIISAPSLEVAEAVTSSHCVLIPLGNSASIGNLHNNGVFSEAPVEE